VLAVDCRLLRGGYGKIKIKQKIYSAHRLAYYVAHGSIDANLNVNHIRTCIGNRACCNPSHLYQGTQRENVLDMHAQRHKYTVVTSIRARAAAGESAAAISRDLGVPARTVYDYINNVTRKYAA
jgi:hypothetical protein